MNSNIMIPSVSALPLRQPDTSSVSKAKEGFGKILSETIDEVNRQQIDGDIATKKLQTGEAEHLHEVILAVEQADISLRMLVQMRNRAQQAFEEIMRLQL